MMVQKDEKKLKRRTEKKKIIELHVKARDIRGAHTSLFVPQGPTVFITLTKHDPSLCLSHLLSLFSAQIQPSIHPFESLFQIEGFSGLTSCTKLNPTHTHIHPTTHLIMSLKHPYRRGHKSRDVMN